MKKGVNKIIVIEKKKENISDEDKRIRKGRKQNLK